MLQGGVEGMSREERAVLAAWERVQAQERKGSEKQRREQMRASRKSQERPVWISKMQTDLQDVPEFRPTEEEFADPLAYIRSIAAEGAKYGACKIIPPESFRPSCRPSRAEIPTTRQQLLNRVFDDGGTSGGRASLGDEHVQGVAFHTSHTRNYRTYTIPEYKRLGDQRYVKHCRDNNFPPPKCGADSVDAVGASGEANDAHAGLGYTVYLPKDETKSPCEDVILEEGLVRTMDEKQTEREFWHTMSSSMNFSVQYANDIEGTASKDFDMWDLSKVPTSSRCLLRELPDLIPGVTTPMLYIGMLFAHFCWHYEDNALYSVNAMHVGAPKTWYVVPGSAAAALEKAADDIFSNHPDRYHPLMHGAHMLMRKTVMMSPSILLARGVPVYRATQRAREMIVTFPRGYHSGFNHGFHTGEAINFAMPDWIPYGLASLNRYRTVSSLSVIDMERLIFDIAHQLAQCKVHSAALPALKSGEGEEDVGNLQASVQQRCAFKHSVLMCRKLGSETAGALPDDKASKASKAETDETTGWKDLMNREDLTAALWAVRALAGWQYEVHRKASESPLIVRVKVMDEEQRKGTGISVLDKQLCCACNHILHTAWVEQEDDDDETEAPTDTHDYSLKHVLAPRSCPDHMEFLGQSKPLRLCLRYPHEYLKELLLSLDALSPLLLAVPPMERTDAAKEKTVWPLRGLTDDYLGLTIRSQQCGDVGSFTDTAVSLAATTPPTPALCTACRSLRSSRNTGGESLSFAMSPVLSHEANPVANDTTRGLAEEEDPKVEDVVDAGATAVSDVAYSCLCPIHAWAQQSTTGAQFSHGKLVRKNRRAHLPQSPLFSDNIFPSLQSLVSKTGASLGVSSVALGNFRKHLLRTKPELKTLVPALVQADEEADAEAKHENVEKDKGESDHDGSRASARGKEMEDEKEEEARKHKLQKNAKPVTSRETEKEKYLLDSDSDDDVPLVHRLQRAIGDRVPANTLTPPDKRAYHRKQPSEDKEEQVTATHDKNTRCKLVSKRKHAHGQMEELEHAPTHKHKNTEFSTHREQSPATITREPAPIHVPPASNNDANGSSSLCMPAAEQGGGFAACHDSPLFIHTNPTYARKRWKVIKLCEYTRSDGSRAMTLRIKRKRCKLTPA